jgi:hypothetical protein
MQPTSRVMNAGLAVMVANLYVMAFVIAHVAVRMGWLWAVGGFITPAVYVSGMWWHREMSRKALGHGGRSE